MLEEADGVPRHLLAAGESPDLWRIEAWGVRGPPVEPPPRPRAKPLVPREGSVIVEDKAEATTVQENPAAGGNPRGL